MTSETIKLNSGQEIPSLGLGTSTIDDVYSSVCSAIDAGYRLIDTAASYRNEAEVGRAINNKIKQGVVKREELFVVTKLTSHKHRKEAVPGAFNESLSLLQLEYVDLYLIHRPDALLESCPRNEDGTLNFDNGADYVDTWLALEKLLKSGKTRGIGLSNFNKAQITRILERCEIKPAINQVECHLIFNQERLRAFCEGVGIKLMAYSPLGAPGRTVIIKDAPKLLENDTVIEVSKKYKKTPGQILLRFNIQRGIVVIPKSGNPDRIKENINVFDFQLDTADVEKLMNQNRDLRLVQGKRWEKSAFFAFKDEF